MNETMAADLELHSRADHEAKRALRDEIQSYYDGRREELRLGDVELASLYLPGGERFIERGIIFAQRGLDVIVNAHLAGEPWSVVSGLNPSGPLHLGHKAMFDVLLWLQRDLGATVFIPITNDETYLVGKAPSLRAARQTALDEVIPSIIALGFDKNKTRIILHSDYPAMHQLALHVSRFTTYNNVRGLFGWEGHENPGVVYYMGGLQFASILMPQLREFGGPRPVLVPVGVDQHPYVSLARDVAHKLHIVQPSEMIWKFLGGLKDPSRKMSSSIPGDAVFLNDSPEDVSGKISRSFSGGVPLLRIHRELGAVPEVCSAFQILTYTLEDQQEWEALRSEYSQGQISAQAVKSRAIAEVTHRLREHQELKSEARSLVDDFLFDDPLPSVLGSDDPFALEPCVTQS